MVLRFGRSLAFSLRLGGSGFLRSLLCSSSELCSGSGTLLCDSSGFSFVGLYLLSVESLCSSGFLVRLSLADLAGLCIFLRLPCLETLLRLFLTECALGYTTLQMLVEQYALTGENVTNGVGGLSTYVNPMECALKIEDHCRRVGVRIERTDTLDVLAVTRRTAVCYYDVVESIVFVAMTSQTNFCCHFFVVVFVGVGLLESLPGLIICTLTFVHSLACFFTKKPAKLLLFFEMCK